MHVWIIDHYDSFTFNVRDWLLEHPAIQTVHIVSYDDAVGMAAVLEDPSPIVLSPGPKDPAAVVPTIELIRNLRSRRPVLGICLGHQVLGIINGIPVVRSLRPLHGSAKRLKIPDGWGGAAI